MKIGHKTLSASGKLLSTTVLGSGALLLLLGAPGVARADDLPTGGNVVAGAAVIGGNGQATTINQSSSRAVINWDSFSVSQGKTVTFVQPDVHSATLNRVTGDTTSTIAGQITSNGAIYLVNPNGIAITATGAVQTGGGFVASTLAMADGDFMAGKAKFTGSGSSGSVSNAGHISAGQGAYVALLGGSVANSGTIAVPLGRVGLGSGESITLDLNGDGFMQVAVPTSAVTGDKALISHSGSISASGGFVVLEAATVKDAVRNVINLSGDINADSATGSAGNIRLFGGDGGTVTVSGTLSAQATGTSGNGGLVETSGASVDYAGVKVNTSSIGGKSGTWLIDPYGLIIDAASAATISSNLATTDVSIATNADGTTSGPGVPVTDPYAGASPFPIGSIQIYAPISWTSSHMLSVSAYTGIGIYGAITGLNGGLTLAAGVGHNRVDTISASAAVNVGSFELVSGFWTQNSAVGFSAGNFMIHPDTAGFLRTAGGSGSANDPYLITDIYGLQGIYSNIGRYDPIGGPGPALRTLNYLLVNDIDASGTALWNSGRGFLPIGNATYQFTGSLSGSLSGSTINGLTINNDTVSSLGLFGYVGSSGNISDVHLIGGTVRGAFAQDYPALYIGALAGRNDGTIRRSSASTIVNGSSIYQVNVGGLVGLNVGFVTASSASGAVTGSGYFFVGGLVGNNWNTITKSFATGLVTGNQYSGMAGGLVGSHSGLLISQSYATGDVHVTNQSTQAGGFAGSNYSNSAIEDSYATGSVSATVQGAGSGVISLGGFVGDNGGSITRSYSTGSVNPGVASTPFIGGFVGLTRRFVTNSFWNITTSGQTTDGSGAIALTNTQMQNFDSYATIFSGFDFLNVWAPPALAGQAGQAAGYFPQLYATAPIAVLTGTATKVYGAPLSSIVAGLNGGPGLYAFGPAGDTLAAPPISGPGVGAGSNVGSYAITFGAGNSANSALGVTYRIINGNGAGTLSVTPAALTITYAADPLSRLYGAANPALTGTESTTGLVNGDTLAGVTAGSASYATAATSGSNVGSYAINGSGLTANSGNYNFTFAQAAGNATALTINPASLTVTYTADPFSRLYGAANPALTGTQSATGLVNGDTLAGVTSGTASYATTATTSANVGNYAINGSGLSANSANYNFTFAQAKGNATALTINPASLTVTYTADPFSRLYGAANPTLTGTQSATGLVNGDTLAGVTAGTASYATTATSGSNVGSYAINGSGLAANSANYSFTFAQAAGNATALTINPASLTITYTADPFSRLYGAANPTFTGSQSATGLVNGDTLAGVTSGTASYATTATTASNIGSYAINGSGLSANSGNYSFTFAQAAGNATALTINPASLTVVADPLARFYGAANPALTYVATGLVNGDTLSGNLATSATAASSIGTYGITQGSLAASSNYALSFTGALLTINPAALTVVADPLSRTYGAANPTLTYVTTGLVNGDTLSGNLATSATTASSVGTYGITQGSLSASSNYALNFTGALLTINPAALTVTYTADPFSRLYGAANPALTGTQTATGLVNGDTLAGVTTGTASYATAATSGSNVGSYAINGSGLAANSGNYSFTFAQAAGNASALTITPASLTVTYIADPFSRFYGAANPAFTGTQSAIGLVNGDTLAGVTTGTAGYATTATTGSNIGSYAINGSGLSANSGNYSFTFAQAAGNATALTINPASLTVVANPLSRTYGAANPALTYVATGLANGDMLSGNLATSATTASSVGTYGITQGSLAASSNYALSFTGALLTINPAALTITYTADPFSRLYGVANPAFTGAQTATGLVNGDTLAGVTTGTASYATAATAASNVGNYAINGSGLSANSANYNFTFAQAAGNATALKITPRPLSVTADPISRQFGAPNPPLTYVIAPTTATSGLVNGDGLTGALSTIATSLSPSGDYAILQGSLMASSNYIFNYTGANLTIELPPLQSLSSFVPVPTGHEADQAGAKGCTSDQMSEQLREKGEAKVGTGTGNTSCD